MTLKRTELLPYQMVLHVMEESRNSYGFCAGELHITLDSHDTAWVEPCSRLIMTEDIVKKLGDFLRPFGVTWMRGWHDGNYVGRTISADGNIGVVAEPKDYPLSS